MCTWEVWKNSARSYRPDSCFQFPRKHSFALQYTQNYGFMTALMWQLQTGGFAFVSSSLLRGELDQRSDLAEN